MEYICGLQQILFQQNQIRFDPNESFPTYIRQLKSNSIENQTQNLKNKRPQHPKNRKFNRNLHAPKEQKKVEEEGKNCREGENTEYWHIEYRLQGLSGSL